MAAESHSYKTEKGRAIVRTLHANALQEAGAARRAALETAEAELDRIARLMPAALKGGLSLAEIARVTGVSRPTLYELRARYSESDADLRLAVLQTLATEGALSESELSRRLGGPRKGLSALIQALLDQGFLDGGVEEGDDGPYPLFSLSPQGLDLLEHWTFEEERAEREGGQA